MTTHTTEELFRQDAYLKECSATVVAVRDNAVVTDQSIFYSHGGGQPGDIGEIRLADGHVLNVVDTRKDHDSGEHLHLIAETAQLPKVGDNVVLAIDWQRRHRLMRMHSCMHMLCAVVPAAVTGGSIAEDSARLDFFLPDPPDKAALEAQLNDTINKAAESSLRWISEDELATQPELVRTMSVQPPKGSGSVRLVDFTGIDLQPCGGTHVANSAEIGAVKIQSIKSKGKQNRRVTVVFADA